MILWFLNQPITGGAIYPLSENVWIKRDVSTRTMSNKWTHNEIECKIEPTWAFEMFDAKLEARKCQKHP